MAAIIAQMTRAKREQRHRRGAVSGAEDLETKCHFSLPQFETRFDPKIHNKYMKRWGGTCLQSIDSVTLQARADQASKRVEEAYWRNQQRAWETWETKLGTIHLEKILAGVCYYWYYWYFLIFTYRLNTFLLSLHGRSCPKLCPDDLLFLGWRTCCHQRARGVEIF